VFNEEGDFVRRIGGENITNFPNGIDVSDAGQYFLSSLSF
jgi:tripartite motif-containing protein 2/3